MALDMHCAWAPSSLQEKPGVHLHPAEPLGVGMNSVHGTG